MSSGRLCSAVAAGVWLITCRVCWLPLPARAFSDPASFERSTPAAGGGGRFFTGSPADGYTCKVCHEGGTEPRLRVLGFADQNYIPGGSYEVMIDWLDAVTKFSALVEITDAQGRAAGSIRLPPRSELLPAELCEPAIDGVPAASLVEATNRQVIAVPDCGAKQLRFLWTAPAVDIGPVWLAGSAVASDGQADVAGDGVTDVRRIIGSPTATESIATQLEGGCASVGARDLSSVSWFVAVMVCLRRHRRR